MQIWARCFAPKAVGVARRRSRHRAGGRVDVAPRLKAPLRHIHGDVYVAAREHNVAVRRAQCVVQSAAAVAVSRAIVERRASDDSNHVAGNHTKVRQRGDARAGSIAAVAAL